MSNASGLVQGIGAGGGLAVAWQAVKFLQEEVRRRAEKRKAEDDSERAAAREPLIESRMFLGVASEAAAIQQRAIVSLKEEIDQLRLEVSTLRTENTSQRQEIARQQGEIQELYATIGRLQMRPRPADP